MNATTTREFHKANAISGYSIEDYLPYSWIIDDMVVFKNLSVGAVLEVELPPYFTADDTTKEYYHTIVSQFLNSLDEQFDVQFLWGLQRNCDDIIRKLEALEPDNRFIRAYHQQQLQRLRERASNNLIRRYRMYITIVHKPLFASKELRYRAKNELKFRSDNGLLTRFCDYPLVKKLLGIGEAPDFAKQYTEAEWKQIKDSLLLVIGGLEQSLQQLGLKTEFMHEPKLMATLFEWWNPNLVHQGITVTPTGSTPTPITDYFVISPMNMDRKKGYLYFDNKVHRILTLRTPPTDLKMNVFEDIFQQNSIPNLRIINNFVPYSKEKRLQELQDKLPIFRARVEKDLKMLVTVEQLQREILSIQRGEESVWAVTTVFHVWGDTEEEVDKYAHELKQQARLSGRAIVVQEEQALWVYWTSAQPFWPSDLDVNRQHLYSASQAVCLIPFTGHPERVKEPLSVLLETGNRAPFNFNPFDYQRVNNYNCLIMGTAGTGKSFAAGSIALAMMLHNARIIGIDLGGSYFPLCEALGGNYVTMDPDSKNQTINPLAIGGLELQSSEKVLISKFLEKAVKEKDSLFSRVESSYVDEVLNQLFTDSGGKTVRLTHLREHLARYGKPETKVMAEALGQWCEGGRYGALFDGNSKVDFDKPFTIFDLTLVKENQDLAPLTLMSIINNVYKMAAKYPNQPKILLMDEAWVLMKNPITAKFVEECFRTFRKLNIAVIAISQGIDEWLTEGAVRILGNVNTYYLLGQTNASAADKLAEVLQLSERESDIIKVLKTVKGQYSQALFIQAGNTRLSTVLLNRPSPLQYAIMTTNPSDKSLIARIKSEMGCNEMDARIEFAKRFPNGA